MVTTSAPPGPRWRWEGGFVVLFLRTFFEEVTGSVEADSESCLEGCGLGASCGNRGRRTRLQRGFAACVVVSDLGLCSRGSLTPVAAPNVSPNAFLAGDRLCKSGFGSVF
jgi:hypothetical protein